MKIWFTSDTHFWHKNIIKYCNRPFKDEVEMTEKLIANWNARVGSNDIVYHLGDFAYGRESTPERIKNVASRLNGIIRLIEGNHDKRTLQVVRDRFEWVKKYDEIMVEGQAIVLFHYGLRTWHHDTRGVWHLYGHSHNLLPGYGKSFDIGVDAWDYQVVSFEQVKARMDKLEQGKHPMFANKEYAPLDNILGGSED